MSGWNDERKPCKGEFSSFLNKYPNALVVKWKLKVTPQRVKEADRLFERFAYQMQLQAHQLKGQAEGSFACPILVSWTCCEPEQKGGDYFVALTFNLEAFGRQTKDVIKKKVGQWVRESWGKVLRLNMVYPMVKQSPVEPYTPLRPGTPQYRYAIEELERTFAGDSPYLSYPLLPFKHRMGFYPKGAVRKRTGSRR
ncbi:hypothetical protein WB894_002710 [Vibrio vulnificus]|nr:hypothetical protein [Vibrio vulnificus]EHH1188657.1 hypothetical protein [Vibrio vulnificus]EHU4846330.1 hypothetical protein [Vibrio vulnificus]EIA1302924.1 hypothetical protein [Vibrio vulnificus]EIV8482009.1 hypothetical protein [Vibrio vulnificus]